MHHVIFLIKYHTYTALVRLQWKSESESQDVAEQQQNINGAMRRETENESHRCSEFIIFYK